MIRNVKLVGFDEIQKKLNADILVQPELDDARDSFVARMKRGGKGLGVQRNTLSATVVPLGATVQSTLHVPRTVGSAWTKKNEAVVKAMAPAVMKKAIRRMEDRWATANGGGA